MLSSLPLYIELNICNAFSDFESEFIAKRWRVSALSLSMGHLGTKFTDTGDMLVEMPEEAPASKSSTEHSRDHNTFIHLVACGSPAPHRVRAAEGHEIWIEKFERFSPQFISVFAQFILPEVGHVILTETFEGHLGHGLLEEGKRVWQVVLVAQVPDICDPVLTTLAGASEELTNNTV